jgi:hypothetical protein
MKFFTSQTHANPMQIQLRIFCVPTGVHAEIAKKFYE